MKDKLIKIKKGHYIYRGFEIIHFIGFPNQWGAKNNNNVFFAHSNSLKGCMMWINLELDGEPW